MFVPDYNNAIPGYTGHRPQPKVDPADLQQPKEARKQIPGYAGHIPGVKSENVFGETYGKTTLKSGKDDIKRGLDLAPGAKFNSMAQSSFVNHSEYKDTLETVAQLVGVHRGEDVYKMVSGDLQLTFELQPEGTVIEPAVAKVSDPAEAVTADDSVAKSLGGPIPGYSGISRRVQADNIFGMTFNEARKMAVESQKRINEEKDETLNETLKWIPEDQRMAK